MRIDKKTPSSTEGRFGKKNINSRRTGLKRETTGINFKKELANIDRQEIKERLAKLMVIIDEEGEKLKKSLDSRDLAAYKKEVKEYLKIIQQEFTQARQSFSWDRKGNLKTYTIIEKVDKNLDALHQLFLEEQADALKVLKKIDEIRGLLLDLYI